jgi:hypothetical protein
MHVCMYVCVCVCVYIYNIYIYNIYMYVCMYVLSVSEDVGMGNIKWYTLSGS